jgi:hypothetical protein
MLLARETTGRSMQAIQGRSKDKPRVFDICVPPGIISNCKASTWEQLNGVGAPWVRGLNAITLMADYPRNYRRRVSLRTAVSLCGSEQLSNSINSPRQTANRAQFSHNHSPQRQRWGRMRYET